MGRRPFVREKEQPVRDATAAERAGIQKRHPSHHTGQGATCARVQTGDEPCDRRDDDIGGKDPPMVVEGVPRQLRSCCTLPRSL